MNERQPYEQKIAEKLQQLPAPDADASWQQMKRLLDDDDSPAGGAGGKNSFRPGKGWWRAGVIAVVITAALWIFTENRKSATKEIASNKTSIENNATNSTNNVNNNTSSANVNRNKPAVTTDNTSIPVISNKSVNTNSSNNNTITGNSTTNKEVNKTNSNINIVESKNEGNSVTDKVVASKVKDEKVRSNSTNASIANNNAVVIKKNHQNDVAAVTAFKPSSGNSTTSKKDKEGKNFFAKRNTRSTGTTPYRINNATHNNGVSNASDVVISKSDRRSPNNKNSFDNSGNTKNERKADNNNHQNNIAAQTETTIPHGKEQYIGFNELKLPFGYDAANTSLAAGDSVGNKPRTIALNKETNNAVAKTQREEAARIAAKKDRKSINLADVFKPFS